LAWTTFIDAFSTQGSLIIIIIIVVVVVVVVQWYYSPMWTFTLFFDISFQFVILHLLISVFTPFHVLILGHPLS